MQEDDDYIGKRGCCLVCRAKGHCHNPCFGCRCSKCSWYEPPCDGKITGGFCIYSYLKQQYFDEVLCEVSIIAETEKAYLFDLGNYKDWLPKSQVDVKLENGKIHASIPNWLLRVKGRLEDDDLQSEMDDYLGEGVTFADFEKEHFTQRFHRQDFRIDNDYGGDYYY